MISDNQHELALFLQGFAELPVWVLTKFEFCVFYLPCFTQESLLSSSQKCFFLSIVNGTPTIHGLISYWANYVHHCCVIYKKRSLKTKAFCALIHIMSVHYISEEICVSKPRPNRLRLSRRKNCYNIILVYNLSIPNLKNTNKNSGPKFI